MRVWLAIRRGAAALRRGIVAAVSAIEARDMALVLGLALVGYGLSLVWIPAALIVPGAVLTAVAVFGTR